MTFKVSKTVTLTLDVTLMLMLFKLYFNLPVVGDDVWHPPWLTKLTHNTTAQNNTEVVSVCLPVVKEIIVKTTEQPCLKIQNSCSQERNLAFLEFCCSR